jgi:hypothetical protein
MESGTSRKFALASLIVGAALAAAPSPLGFGVACGVFVVYSVFNLWEKRHIGPDEVD